MSLQTDIRLSVKPLTLAVWSLFLGLAAFALVPQASSLPSAAHLVLRADLRDLPPLVVLETIFFANLGMFYFTCFRSSGLRAELRRFTLLASAGNFVNMVSKSSGFGALALFLGEERRTGESRARIALAFGASYALGEVAFLTILGVAAAGLYLHGSLTVAESAAIGAVFVLMGVAGTVIFASLRSREAVERLYRLAHAPAGLVARIRRRPGPDSERVRASAEETFEAVHFIAARRRQFGLPFASALGVEIMSGLFLLFSADLLGIHLSLGTALAGYAISIVATILSVTPGGLGFAEGSLVVFLVSSGLNRENAIAVTLVYRLFTYWLPVVIGGACLVYLKWRDAQDGAIKLAARA